MGGETCAGNSHLPSPAVDTLLGDTNIAFLLPIAGGYIAFCYADVALSNTDVTLGDTNVWCWDGGPEADSQGGICEDLSELHDDDGEAVWRWLGRRVGQTSNLAFVEMARGGKVGVENKLSGDIRVIFEYLFETMLKHSSRSDTIFI